MFYCYRQLIIFLLLVFWEIVIPTVKASDNFSQFHIATPDMSLEISSLKIKAIEQIEANIQVINYTEYLPMVNSIDFVIDVYAGTSETILEKSVRQLMPYGDAYYDESNKVVMVIPPNNNTTLIFIFLEINGCLYEVAIDGRRIRG